MPDLLVQLSDTHIREHGHLAYGCVDTAAYLTQSVKAIINLSPAIKAVLITGDLTDFGAADEYAHLRDLLSPIVCPVYLMPGNHDSREVLREAFPDHEYLRKGDDQFIQYTVNFDGLRLIVADTTVPNESHGAFCSKRRLWLRNMLEDDKNTPTILAIHHPPFTTYIKHMDAVGIVDGLDELTSLVSEYNNIERVVCGHLHRSIQVRWAGTVAVTAPSTAHQVSLNLSSNARAEFNFEPPGYLIHAWSPSGPLVTHLAFSNPFLKNHPFHDKNGIVIR